MVTFFILRYVKYLLCYLYFLRSVNLDDDDDDSSDDDDKRIVKRYINVCHEIE